jgi:hypothetical protein
MAKKGFFVGMLAVTLVFGMALAGCSSDDGGGLSLNLPAITEPVSGQPTITYTNVPLTGESIPNIALQTKNYGTWSVTDGKLSLTLTTPSNPVILSKEVQALRDIFGDTTGANKLDLSVEDAKFVVVFNLEKTEGQDSYKISRGAGAGDATSFIECAIRYLYVDKDVTITRDAKTAADDFITYAAINLPLKAGWNLVQTDENGTQSESSNTIKLADKDVPWSYYPKKK